MMIKSSKGSLMKAAILVLVIVFLILGSASSVLAGKDCSSTGSCHKACDYSVYYDCTDGGNCPLLCFTCFDCYDNGYCSGACGICGGSCTTDVECGGGTPTCENPPEGETTGCTCVPEFSPSLGLVALFSAVSISTLIYKYKKRS